MSYKLYLKAIGRKPLPPLRTLRTEKLAGHKELVHGRVIEHPVKKPK